MNELNKEITSAKMVIEEYKAVNDKLKQMIEKDQIDMQQQKNKAAEELTKVQVAAAAREKDLKEKQNEAIEKAK